MAEELNAPLGNQPQPYYTGGMWNIVAKLTQGLTGIRPIKCVVEIGSFRGEWTRGLLARFTVERYFAVDPWRAKSAAGRRDPGEQNIWDDHFRAWLEIVGNRAWKSVFPLRGTSEEWARVFPYEIDLLYIDGKHNYINVLGDLNAWYPKLRIGGLVIGHDYNLHSVSAACRAFFGEEELQVTDTGPLKANRASGGKSVMTQSFWKIKK